MLGSGVSASVTGLSVLINTAGGMDSTNVPASPLNWKSAVSIDGGATFGAIIDPGATIAPAGSVSLPITATGGVLLLSGSLTSLNIFNVIAGSANFALSESTVDPVVGSATLTGATLLTLALSNLVASAGAGGFGVSITGGNLGIALLEAPKPQSGTDSRFWLAAVGNGLAGSLALGGSVSASVSNLSVAINSAGGQDASNTPASPIDWNTVFTPAIDPGAIISPAGSVSLPITAAAGELLLSGSLTGLNIFNVITGSADFALSRSTVSPVVGGTTLTGATLLTLALSNLQASAGAGGFGVSINGGNLGIAVLEAPRPQSGTDSRYWLAVIGNALAGSLSLGSAVSASASAVAIAINTAGGQDTTGHAATALDWSTVFASPAVNPGSLLPGNVDLTIAFTMAESSLSGSLTTLNIFNVITGSANFALEPDHGGRLLRRHGAGKRDGRHPADPCTQQPSGDGRRRFVRREHHRRRLEHRGARGAQAPERYGFAVLAGRSRQRSGRLAEPGRIGHGVDHRPGGIDQHGRRLELDQRSRIADRLDQGHLARRR